MSISLNKLLNGKNPQSILYEETKKLVNKWQPTGLLKGLKNETEVRGMAVLLENQAKQILKEASRVNGEGSEEWAGVALPLVRRIFGEIVAKEFVSVQPMNLPSGLVFYLDFKYGSNSQPGYKLGESVYGGDKNPDGTQGLFGRTNSTTGGLYGAGRFGYSLNDREYNVPTASVSLATWEDVNYDYPLSASIAGGGVNAPKKVRITLPASLNADAYGARAFALYSGSVLISEFPEYTQAAVDNTNGNLNVSFIVSTPYVSTFTTGSIEGVFKVAYHIQPPMNARGDFEDPSTSSSYIQLDIPEIDIILKSEPIVSKTRKLKAAWTDELQQDLAAYHSIDAEAELSSILSNTISMEIDKEILDMLLQNAATTEIWSARIGYEFDETNKTFVQSAVNNQAYTKSTWFQTLAIKIQKVSNIIHSKTLRGGANFIVTSPQIATALETIPGFVADTDGNAEQFSMGVSKVGSFASRFKVYKNPYMTENVILLGYKGNSFLEAGATYNPYIPLIMSPVIYDPTNFTPRRAIMTRYAKAIIRPEFYGRILVAHSNFI